MLTEGFDIHTGGLRIAGERSGDSDAPTIVLIRGLGTQMIEWPVELLEALTGAGLQVIIFDNRDAGLSTKLTTQYALADMAADVVAIMDALAVERAHIFGISLGGMIAQLVGLHYPHRVRCLFSVMSTSGAADLPAADPEIRARMTRQAQGREAIIELDAANRAAFGSPAYPESLQHRLSAAARAYDRCYCPEGVARQLRAAVTDGCRRQRLAQIAVPTLVVHGVEDPLLPLACGEDTAAHIPHAEFQGIPGMGHNIPAALAGDIATRVVDFVSRHDT